jgi:hypothetical protein
VVCAQEDVVGKPTVGTPAAGGWTPVEITGAGGWTTVETPVHPPASAPLPPAGQSASNGGGEGPGPALSGRGLSGFTIPCAQPRNRLGQPSPGNVFEAAEPADPKRRALAGGAQSSFTPSGDGCPVAVVRLAMGLCCLGLWGCWFVVKPVLDNILMLRFVGDTPAQLLKLLCEKF